MKCSVATKKSPAKSTPKPKPKKKKKLGSY